MYDVIVIGAGPAGMMCAVTASQNHKKVLLIDKNNQLGKKMRLSGGGRCNITNLKETKEFIKHLPLKDGRFLYSALNQFSPELIYQFFENLNVPLKLENEGRVFPISNKAIDFVEALQKELDKNKVEVKLNTEIVDINLNEEIKTVYTPNQTFQTHNVVIATGGLSYPHTGSTGSGHTFGKKFNHTITEIYPTESPIISHDPLITSKVLQGLSFENINLALIDEDNKVIKSHQSDLIFTHFGLSGPAALKLSQFIYHYLKDQKQATLLLDVHPALSLEALSQQFKESRHSQGNKTIKTILKKLLPERFLNYIIEKLNINSDLKCADLSNKVILQIIKHIKSFEIVVHDVKPIEQAFVTGGGVSLDEVDPKTMESKLIPGLYFVGEVLNLHGYTGGYNITIALTTGYAAGIALS